MRDARRSDRFLRPPHRLASEPTRLQRSAPRRPATDAFSRYRTKLIEAAPTLR
jgi:hypothetical protein